VTALKSVDFPTFGSPTIPALNIRRAGYGGSTEAAIRVL
jgi:hypothetical protein